MVSRCILGILSLYLFYAPLSLAKSIPDFTSPVMDEAQLLNSNEKAELESWLISLFSQGGSQIVVYTTPSLEQEDIAAYSIRVLDKWKLGTAKADNGVLLLISKEDKKLRIEVGQGLEGVLVDAYSKRIIDQVITPHFKQGLFSRGIFAGVDAIIRYTDPDKAGAPIPPPTMRRKSSPFSILLFLLISMVIWISHAFGGPRRRYGLSGYSGTGFGGGGFGGGGGGGFSGGGGGGFSGGGASGGW